VKKVKKIKRVIVVTGTPGVGKSSVSKLLASKMKTELISLGVLIEKEKLYSGLDKRRDTFIADMGKVSRRVQEIIASSSRDVMIEGHFAVEVVPPSSIHRVFVLRRDPEEMKGVLEKRGYKEEKVFENLAAEILDVCLYDAVRLCGLEKVCEIDVTGRDVDEVVEEIILILRGMKKCKVGIVDWLGKLEAEGQLDQYLKNF